MTALVNAFVQTFVDTFGPITGASPATPETSVTRLEEDDTVRLEEDDTVRVTEGT